MQVNIDEAKTLLASLLDRAESGEEVIIARAGKPSARLVSITPARGSRSGVRFGGLRASCLKLAPDFHAPMTGDDLLGS
jgi:prevent-host-death family protein